MGQDEAETAPPGVRWLLADPRYGSEQAARQNGSTSDVHIYAGDDWNRST